ncbi:MAG: hypothetical protein AAFW89_13010 [Bacteroidota bacterium]
MSKEITYIKNPAELALLNPAPERKKGVGKDPRRVAAGKKAWKTTTTKQQNRQNPMKTKELTKTGKKMFARYGAAAVGSFVTVSMVDYLLSRFGTRIPRSAREWGSILVPASVGVLIAAKSKESNIAAQGIAGGMVFSAVSQTLNKALPLAEAGTAGLSDALGFKNRNMLAEVPQPVAFQGGQSGSMVIDQDGIVRDQNGNPYAKAVPQNMLADSNWGQVNNWELEEQF